MSVATMPGVFCLIETFNGQLCTFRGSEVILNCFPAVDIQCASADSCILCDSSGQLWYFHPPRLQQIMLPSSQGGHSVFAVQAKHGQTEGWFSFSSVVNRL